MYKVEYPSTQVIYGKDALDWLVNLKSSKVGIVTTRSLLQGKTLSLVTKLVNADIIEGPRQHVPEDDVNALKEKVGNYETIIGLGGGSIIDGLKLVLEEKTKYIVIPTTLSGAEHTKSGGYTTQGLKRSKLGKEPDIVILDPRATLETPKWLLVSSAVRSIDHAVEALYSRDSTPFVDSLAKEGFHKIVNCLRDIDSLDSRLECQIGVWLSSLTMRYARMGMSHMFGYVFGPRFNIPHGYTSCISLPAAVKFNYGASKEKLKSIEKNEPLYEFLDNFLREIGVRKKLSEYTSLEEALKYAEVFSQLSNNSGNPTKLSIDDARKFIQEVY
ncbi:iron-containing alcohol dehydrogenase [Sulfolobus acidocaldarius]|uniref:Dehydrogenase n=4 Tax=Sulfolobus acidocaldarius TaxID=2285 RepID=Q4J9T9_SULAC|nr:iron-containing alcohol dehydrogenase [Sulfolobus acidocaldarius]AAY80442.1 dehydrogenase [Sulfolobus acidocaldarius DSM 639]AGE71026.1 dehydrogenase [Sulfolobus acidocaldarius N8]AGE73297.1 dehydrogenase [Sulfolobus acidocaldarius Ron12/I]ALU28681.1 alcohol dehydrogenase [Sulfolobus acidocaldarius]ALU31398.1 alcohol dehydrogenase [Sulfolobus acidocaldarius]